jgi:hypothetical protein
MTDGRTANDFDPKGAAAMEIPALWSFMEERMADGTKGVENGRTKVA